MTPSGGGRQITQVPGPEFYPLEWIAKGPESNLKGGTTLGGRSKVRIYKYPQSSTARLVGLEGGGNGVLCKFIAAYKKEISRFTGPGLANPVVILYDNDTGAKSIREHDKKCFQSTAHRCGALCACDRCFFREVLLRAEDFRPKAA